MTNAELGTMAVGGILSTVLVCFLIFYIFLIVAIWKIFTKAGEAGWKSLIPIYNVYILYKISGVSFWTWFFLPTLVGGLCVGLLAAMIPSLAQFKDLLTSMVAAAVDLKLCIALADAFGKGTGFKVGLFFLPNIFTLILGFGSAEYVGPADK